MSKFRQTDLWYTEECDLAVDASGDLKDTRGNYGRAIIQEIRTRLRANQGDWKASPQLGANITGFLGSPGTAQHINRVASRLLESLTQDGLLDPSEVEIVPFQVNDEIVLFRILVYTQEDELILTFGFDTNEKRFIGY